VALNLEFMGGKSKSMIFVVLAVASVVALLSLFFFNPFSSAQLGDIIDRSGYYFCALVSLLLLFFLFRSFSCHLRSRAFWIKFCLTLSALLPLSLFLHLHEPHRFKVLNDEYTLSSVAKQMHFERRTGLPVLSFTLGQQHAHLAHFVDKRSQLFPFLVSITHDLIGFRPGNVFLVNGLFSLGLLFLIYLCVRRITQSRLLASWACLFASSIPLLAQVATSGGYDLAYTFFICLLLYASLYFVEKPSEQRMDLLIICGVVLAYVRYESILYLIPVVLLVLYWWWEGRSIRLTLFASLSPLLACFPVLLYLNMVSNEQYWATDMRENGESFFGFEHIVTNLQVALGYFFTPSLATTSSVLCSLLGIVGLVFLFVIFFARGWRKEAKVERAVGLVLATVGLCFLLIMSHFWGQLNDHQAVRFGLPMYVCSVFAIVLLLQELPLQKWLPGALYFQIIYLFIFTTPSAAAHKTTNEMVSSYFQEWAIDTVGAESDRQILLVSQSSMGAHLFDQSVIVLSLVNENPEMLLHYAKRYQYEEVWVAECMAYSVEDDTWSVVPSLGQAADWLPMEPVKTKLLNANIRGRLSRVLLEDIDLESFDQDLILDDAHLENPANSQKIEIEQPIAPAKPNSVGPLH
jgi:hypothetical protein